MARSCACDRLLTRAAGDLGFRALPVLARLLWFELLAAATAAAEKGHIRFPGSVSASVSQLGNRSETDVASDLAALEELGWVDLDNDGRGLWMPGMRAALARTEAARSNGVRGGRPRKGETLEAYRERRQGHLPLSIVGGRAETQETETEPRPESSRAAAKPIAIEAKQAADAREETDVMAFGAEIADILGLDHARGGFTYQPVKAWLDAGISPDLIRDVARRRAETARAAGKRIGGFSYLREAVPEAHQRAAPPAPPAPRPTSGFEAACRQWRENGAQGAPPSLAEWTASQAMAS